jgi:teichuronic acid biosynthesis glycosyltransferase TuaH
MRTSWAPSPPSGDGDAVVVLCAGAPWGSHGSADFAVARSLTRHARVVYVDPPVSPLADGRDPRIAAVLQEPPLRPVDDRVVRLTPRVPPARERPGGKLLADRYTRRALGRAMAELGEPEVPAVIVSSYNPLFGSCGERRRVFWAQDDYLAGAELLGISPRRLRRAERAQLRRADLVVGASEVLAERFEGPGHDTLLMANGCDPTLGTRVDAADVAEDIELSGPIAIVVGCLNERLDPLVLAAVAGSGLSLLLVGPCAAGWRRAVLEPLLRRPNVQWIGARAPEELPPYLAAAAVGLVPYRDTAFNRASFPLKTLEYLSAGLPVVATDLPAVRWLATDLVAIEQDPLAFADAVTRAAQGRRDATRIRQRRRFAAGHAWDRRVDVLAEALQIPEPSGAPHLPTEELEAVR